MALSPVRLLAGFICVLCVLRATFHASEPLTMASIVGVAALQLPISLLGRRSALLLPAQAVLNYLPLLAEADGWRAGGTGFVAASVLLVARGPWAWPLFGLIAVVEGCLAATVLDLPPVYVYYAVVAPLNVGLTLYGLSRLADLLDRVRLERSELAARAGEVERLRLWRHVREVVVGGVSTVERLARRRGDVEETRIAIGRAVAVAREALEQVRSLPPAGRPVPLPADDPRVLRLATPILVTAHVLSIGQSVFNFAAGTLFGPRSVVASGIVDGDPSLLAGLGSPYVEVANAQEARAAVRRAVAEGADFIKVYVRLTPDAYYAIADECRKLGVTFVGHTPDAIPLAEASAAGQRSFEHIYTSWFDTSGEEREIRRRLAEIRVGGGEYNSWFTQTHPLEVLAARTFDPARARKVFGRLAADGSHQVPTLTQHRVFDLPESVAAHDDRLRYLPAATRTGWQAQLERLYLAGRTAKDAAEHRELFRARLRWIGAAHRAGVPVLAGTDTGTAYVYPGFSLHDELENLVQAGFTPMRALQAATSAPARFLGLRDVGTVRRGAIADLAVLDADPLADIRHTRRIHAVIVRGRLIDADRRERMLRDVEAAAGTGTLSARLAGCACAPVLHSGR